MPGERVKKRDRRYSHTREAVGWGLIVVTPLNLILLYLLNYASWPPNDLFTPQVIYALSVSFSLTLVGMVLVIEEIGLNVQEREKRQLKRPEGVVCPVCGAVMRPGQSKCSICGSSPLKECASCGTLMSISSEQCPRCGYGGV